MENELVVLSLFDGISGGQQALSRLGIKYKYYASEIEKNAIAITKYNYPETIFLGNIKEIEIEDLPKIDLLIGGSPCQGFSFAGKREGAITKEKIEITSLEQYLKLKKEKFEFEGQSYLFWEYVRIFEGLKKKNSNLLFLLENVKMQKKWEDIFNKTIGVKPQEINSSLVSAQNRIRYYWTNKSTEIGFPKEKNIKLQDILEKTKKWNKATILGRRINKKGKREDYNKDIPIIQCLEVRASNTEKSNCLTTVEKDTVLTPLPIGRHLGAYTKNLEYRNYTVIERERLQTIKDNYTKYGITEEGKKKEISKSQRIKAIGNGWTIEVIVYILKKLLKENNV